MNLVSQGSVWLLRKLKEEETNDKMIEIMEKNLFKALFGVMFRNSELRLLTFKWKSTLLTIC